MALQIFDTLTQRKVGFAPTDPRRVRIYSCGPTVYNYNHLGNFRAYVFVDILRRYLRSRGFGLNHAMNITDVEDKIIENAAQAGQTLQQFTAPFVQAFLEDLAFLNIEDVEHRPRATESVPAMLELLAQLQTGGHCYSAEGNLYFRIGSFSEYGRLSRLEADNLRTAADGRFDADEYTKEDVRDFALWKATEDGEPGWDSPWGRGRPGWHLECSAMIRQIFGSDGVDIHTGGIDLVFPHHENEIAQSCCAYPGDDFARTWLHNEHLLVDGKKMSKSLGNYFMLRDFSDHGRLESLVAEGRAPREVLQLSEKGLLARALRYLLISFHYRTKLNFTFDNLHAAHSACERLQNFVGRLLVVADRDSFTPPERRDSTVPGQRGEHLLALPGAVGEAAAAWLEGMDDDLNTARGLAALFDLTHRINPELAQGSLSPEVAEATLMLLHHCNEVIAVLDFAPPTAEPSGGPLPGEIQDLIEARRLAREGRDFAEADRIRDQLLEQGIRLIDTPEGTTWEKAPT